MSDHNRGAIGRTGDPKMTPKMTPDDQIKMLCEFMEYLRINGYEVVRVTGEKYPATYQPADKSNAELVVGYVKGSH
jgi:hypothetical protein